MPTDPNTNQPPAGAGTGTTNASAATTPTGGDGKAAPTQQQTQQPDQSAGKNEGSTLLGGKTPEQKDGGAGQQAGDKPAPELELKLPEGMKADEQLLAGFKGIAKDLGLKGEHAQKVVDLYAKHIQAREQADAQLAQKTSEDWANAVRNDKELGGANLDRTLATAAKAIDRYGGPALREFLDVTGFGNHPVLVKVFNAIGKELAEGSLGGAGTSGQPPAGTIDRSPEAQAKRWFDKTDFSNAKK